MEGVYVGGVDGGGFLMDPVLSDHIVINRASTSASTTTSCSDGSNSFASKPRRRNSNGAKSHTSAASSSYKPPPLPPSGRGKPNEIDLTSISTNTSSGGGGGFVVDYDDDQRVVEEVEEADEELDEQERRYSFHRLKMQLGSAGAKLYGREKEEEILQQAFHRTVTDCHQELILISGSPGTGKTALANTLQKKVATNNSFFVAGKFEEQSSTSVPYEVFIKALTDYADQFLDGSDDSQLDSIRITIRQAVGIEGKLLTDIIPALKTLIPDTYMLQQNVPQQPEQHKGSVNNKKRTSVVVGGNNIALPKLYGTAAQNRFRFVFCKFVRALTKLAPLVLFLDDLQWADTASCEMIRNLMYTKDGNNDKGMKLLIVGAHRCALDPEQKRLTKQQESNPNTICVACMEMKPFVATVLDLEKERHKANIRMSAIDLTDLKVGAVCSLLFDLLGECENDIRRLAEVVIIQTRGNIFHVLQFVRLLLDQQFLTKNPANGKWMWDVKIILTKLRSESIMDLVRQTMNVLPPIALEALKVASCMGDEIDETALEIILEEPVGTYLEQAAAEGLLVYFPSTCGYRFAHDWIRHTAYEMTPRTEREEFHLHIGRLLWKSSSPADIDKKIFVIVSLLNVGIKYMKEDRERYRVAELNLRAAEKAAAVSAFPNASKFSRKGIQLLARNRWNDYYELSLALFSLASEVEAINGNYERVVLYIEEIINKGQCLEDKLRAYAALIRSMGQQDNLQEATSVGIDVLEQLGEKVPKPSKFNIMRAMANVNMLLRNKSNYDLINLPPMQNSIKYATLQILNLIFMSSYQARSPYTPLIALRSLAITLKYGLHEASSVSFATYAVMLCGLENDVKAARRYGEIAITLAEARNSREYTPVVYYLFGSAISHWSAPIKDTFNDLLFASKTAMEVGDAEVAVLAKTMKCIHSLFSGAKLSDVEDELDQCISTARLYRKQSTQTLCLLTQQLLECYMGKAPSAARLEGSAVHFKDVLRECKEAHNIGWLSIMYFFSMELAYAFGEFDLAAKMAAAYREEPFSSTFTYNEFVYKSALNAVVMVRRGVDKNANLKIAKANLKRITKWVKESPQTYYHKLLLLEAEIESLKGVRGRAKVYPLYMKAMEQAQTMEYTNECALIAERFADYRLLCGDIAVATELYNQSIELYAQWGAIAKCDNVRAFLSTLTSQNDSTAFWTP